MAMCPPSSRNPASPPGTRKGRLPGQAHAASSCMVLCTVQIKWLLGLVRRPDVQAGLALVPESLPKDAASWLTFVVRSGRAGQERVFVPILCCPMPRNGPLCLRLCTSAP